MSWTEKTRQPETWETETQAIGVGFSPGYAAAPAFAIASTQGIWNEDAEQPEVWVAS